MNKYMGGLRHSYSCTMVIIDLLSQSLKGLSNIVSLQFGCFQCYYFSESKVSLYMEVRTKKCACQLQGIYFAVRFFILKYKKHIYYNELYIDSNYCSSFLSKSKATHYKDFLNVEGGVIFSSLTYISHTCMDNLKRYRKLFGE